MTNLNLKAIGGIIFMALMLGATLFLPAGTFRYYRAWACIGVFIASSTAITFYLMKNDKALLQRRVSAGPTGEKQTIQKVIQSVAQLVFWALFLLSAFDHRFKWSCVPLFVSILADILIAAGFYIVFLVFKENTFTSAIIEVDSDQKVISTGPYAIVRHPMYSGALLLLMAIPVALGSWWGMLAFIPCVAVIVWRLLDEEKFLAANLPGYIDYCSKVRSRLIPGVF
jgi:protein-S-isoprenylcysteine O-methyltransferase Ste14